VRSRVNKLSAAFDQLQEDEVGPSLLTLDRHLEALQVYGTKLDTLGALKAQLTYQFHNENKLGKVFGEIEELQALVRAELLTIRACTEKATLKVMPTKVRAVAKGIHKRSRRLLSGRFDHHRIHSHVSAENDSPLFTSVLELAGVTDPEGFTYDSFHVIVSGTQTKSGFQFSLSLSPSFTPLSTHSGAKQFTSLREGLSLLPSLLAEENLLVSSKVQMLEHMP